MKNKLLHLIIWRSLIGVFLLLILFYHSASGQSIIYIASGNQPTGAVYDNILSDFKSNLEEKMDVVSITSTSWDRDPKQEIVEDHNADYVLILEQLPVINAGDRYVVVRFSLFYPDPKSKRIDEGEWNNSDFRVKLSGERPMNVRKLVDNIYEEIDFFQKSDKDPSKRKFRPRIYINCDSFSSSVNQSAEINALDFCKWLSNSLTSKYSSPEEYVFYFSPKYTSQYPTNSVYTIVGEFVKNSSDNKMITVRINIDWYDERKDVEPTRIYSQEFETNGTQNEALVKNIIKVLENEINYYEKEQ